MTVKRIIQKTLKIILYIVGSIIVLIVVVIIFLQTNYAKTFIRNKAQAYLTGKVHTKITIGAVDFSLPKWIEIKNVYVEDQQKDTLLFAGKLAVDMDMLKLISGEVYVRKISLENIRAKISRSANDSNYNYQFIIDAFTGGNAKKEKTTDTTASKITIKQLIVSNCSLSYKDDYAGSNMYAVIGKLNVTVNKLQPEKMLFDVDEIKTDSLQFTMTTFKTVNKIAPPSSGSSSAVLLLTIKKINLNVLNVAIEDKNTGMFYGNDVNHLEVDKLNIDLAKQASDIDKIALNNSVVKFISPKPQQTEKVTKDATASQSWTILVNTLRLNNDRLQFDDNQKPKEKEGFDAAHIDLQKINIDAKKVFYSADSAGALINQLAIKDQSGFAIDTTHARVLYSSKNISAVELYLKTPNSLIQNAIELNYDSLAGMMKDPKGTTVNAKLANTVIAINDLYLLVPFVKQYLPENKFRNNIVSINTEIHGSLQQLNIPFLQLKGLAGTNINAKAILYNVNDPKNIGYDVYVFNSHIPKSDLVKFAADNKYIRQLPSDLSITTHLKGNQKNSTVSLDLKSSSFKLNGDIDVKNLSNTKALKYNVKVKDGMIKRDFITSFLPPNTLPASIQLPDVITVKGTASGDMDNIKPDLQLGGSYGTVSAKGYINNFKNKEAADYDLQLTANDLAIGKILKQDTLLGNFSLVASAKGKGFNYKTMHSVVSVKADQATVKQYNYHNILLDATIDAGNIKTSGSIADTNIRIQYSLEANVSGEYPKDVNGTIQVDTVRLQQLHLFADTLNMAFRSVIKAQDLDPKDLNFYVLIDSSRINYKNNPYQFDSVMAKATTNTNVHDIVFRSPVADINANGAFDYDKIGNSLLQFLDKYYDVISNKMDNIPDQQISFNGVVKYHPIIADITGGLKYDPIPFKGKYSSNGTDSALSLIMSIPKLNYADYAVSKGKIDVSSFNDRVDYGISFDILKLGSQVFYASDIKGNIAHDSLNIAAVTKDEKNKDRYGLSAAITSKDKAYTVSLKDALLLNYQKWNIAGDNKIIYSPQGILVHNFSLTSKQTEIKAASEQEQLNGPVDISISNFDIKDIAALANADTLLAAGIVNAKMKVSDFDKKTPSFTGEFSIDSFAFMQQPIGNVKFAAQKQDDNAVTASLDINGDNNLVSAKGTYYLDNRQDQFDVNLDVNRLSMSTLQAFSGGNLINTSGAIHGKLAINGSFKEPHWNGALDFDSSKFTLTKTGATYTIDQQKIQFRYPDIVLNNFTIRDSLNNPLSIDGSISANSLTDYALDLNIDAKRFTLVNTPQAIGNQVYGFASANADLTVTGTTSSPNVEGTLSLNKRSNVTLVLPEQNIDKDAAKSVVRFIDRDTFQLPEKVLFVPAGDTTANVSQFFNYNLNIKIDKQSTLTIVIDPSTGDELQVKGDAQLNAGVDPGGNLILAGNYDLDSGYYILNYQFLQRKFNLVKGSSMAFSGNPMDAYVNLTAEYIANTSASDLLENEVGSVDPRTAASFNQKIPFRVLMYLKGELKKPDISFDIQLPDENANIPISNELRTTIENKLAQVRGDAAVTNKEVFSLLVLGRFVGEQSTDFFKSSGSGGGLNEAARESVSSFLSTAMDEIAADLFKGIDVNLNLNSYQDYSTGSAQEKTDLNVEVSKNFLDDRLTVSAGKNFGVEGQDAAARAVQQNSSAFPNVSVNYKLSKDGKYMLRAYRKDQFEVILDGYVVQTGVGFVLTLDYDKFKELFEKKRTKSEKKAAKKSKSGNE
ncbi:translocation/assembly module TamB [Ferruginibacter albus]|uniref:translocation/assembly module TamB n=1 Tax=Ferruginibacter albus TaxID=2875540 RepID=UPI001CC74F18|nr:translocation/assembly module TamB [Ferruginibacter albus]UAY53337.1 translocation/assembly module TamB domain-containing protein [Ferruginibacter albus]